jgi:hypothetical protein
MFTSIYSALIKKPPSPCLDDELPPGAETFILLQADYFSMFFSKAIGFDCTLKPVRRAPSSPPNHFILECSGIPLSTDQKVKIVHWCMEHRPAWVCRWWSDLAFEGDFIVLNKQGQFCIEAYQLLEMILSLDPFLPELVNKLENRLFEQYHQELKVHFHKDHLYISCAQLSTRDLNALRVKIESDLTYKTGETIVLSMSSMFTSESVHVTPARPMLTSNQPGVAQQSGTKPDWSHQYHKRFGQQFDCKKRENRLSGICTHYVNDLSRLLRFLDLSCPRYLPTDSSPKIPVKISIHAHPRLLETVWKFEGIIFNGKWFGADQGSSSEQSDPNPIKKILSSL